MILTVGNIKGGVGKTTLAVNIAIDRGKNAGESVVLIDSDEQGTASLFTEIREQEVQDVDHYTCVKIHGAQVRSQGVALSERFEQTVIDCGGRNTEALRAAIMICDVFLIPLAPRSFDFWAITQLYRLIEEVEAFRELPKILAVINMADPAGQDNQDVIEALKDYPKLKVLNEYIVRRKVWSNAASNGLAAFEFAPQDQKAVDEFNNVLEKIYI